MAKVDPPKTIALSNGPVPFIAHKDGNFLVCDEGAELLSSLDGPLIVVAVAGFYRTGKSFLLNQLAGAQTGGFQVGSTIQSCTRGIDVWVPPMERGRGGGTLVLMDTEGMASMDQDETYDALLFALSLVSHWLVACGSSL